jgi:hypothetical protein
LEAISRVRDQKSPWGLVKLDLEGEAIISPPPTVASTGLTQR